MANERYDGDLGLLTLEQSELVERVVSRIPTGVVVENLRRPTAHQRLAQPLEPFEFRDVTDQIAALGDRLIEVYERNSELERDLKALNKDIATVRKVLGTS